MARGDDGYVFKLREQRAIYDKHPVIRAHSMSRVDEMRVNKQQLLQRLHKTKSTKGQITWFKVVPTRDRQTTTAESS